MLWRRPYQWEYVRRRRCQQQQQHKDRAVQRTKTNRIRFFLLLLLLCVCVPFVSSSHSNDENAKHRTATIQERNKKQIHCISSHSQRNGHNTHTQVSRSKSKNERVVRLSHICVSYPNAVQGRGGGMMAMVKGCTQSLVWSLPLQIDHRTGQQQPATARMEHMKHIRGRQRAQRTITAYALYIIKLPCGHSYIAPPHPILNVYK